MMFLKNIHTIILLAHSAREIKTVQNMGQSTKHDALQKSLEECYYSTLAGFFVANMLKMKNV